MENRFRIILAERKLSVTQVHNDTGISRSTLHGLKQEKSKMVNIEILLKLCNYLDITPNDFFGIKKDC